MKGETGINNSAKSCTALSRLLISLAFLLLVICSPAEALAAASKPTSSTSPKAADAGPLDLSPIKLVKKGYRAFLRAQNEPPVICTDRNSVTPHPNVVPLGYLQFENGSTFDLYRRGGDIILPETEVRLGTWLDGEVRMLAPNYITASGTPGDFRGASDIQISIKQEVERHIFNMKGVDIGVIAGLTLPSGSRSVTTGQVDPFVQMIAFYRRGQYTLGTSHSIFAISEFPDDNALDGRPDRYVTYQPTAILFRHIKGKNDEYEKTDIWMEYAGLFTAGGLPSQIIDFGIVHRPLRRHQIDFRFGFGLCRESPRALMGFGYSWLPGKVIPFYKRPGEKRYRP